MTLKEFINPDRWVRVIFPLIVRAVPWIGKLPVFRNYVEKKP